jgi:hypothetical protein
MFELYYNVDKLINRINKFEKNVINKEYNFDNSGNKKIEINKSNINE